MKKGAIHVDWAMSMGIFLVAIITFIILLKPGVKEFTDTDTLLSLVEEKFNNETLWSVRAIPLHVIKLDSVGKQSTDPPPELTVNVKGGGWSFSKIDAPLYTTIIGGSFGYGEPSGRNFILKCKAKVCSTVSSGKSEYPFILTSSQGLVNDPEPVFDLSCSYSDKDICEGYLGSSEESKGYNFIWINKIATKQKTSIEYENLKAAWGYPITSDFSIYVQGGGLDQNIVANPEAPQQVNVKAKLIRSWLLSVNGTKEPVSISLRVW
ncbi:MAG: hypothetical protein Q8R00_00980 [Candidatus Nanoarchaeia archaeon]|nr:hypothetical protein [Candidatus Nanoarchaeia archaeon]